jgi:hypothetical protein
MKRLESRYSYNWASSVISKLQESTPRATELTLKMLAMSHRDLAGLLAKGDPGFNITKNIIHYVERFINLHPDYYTNVKVKEQLEKDVQCKSEILVFLHLDE